MSCAVYMPASYLNLNTEVSNYLPQTSHTCVKILILLRATGQVQGDWGAGQVSWSHTQPCPML